MEAGITYKKAATIGIILGLTAAVVVWYLERFEIANLQREIGAYLANYDAFREWERQQKRGTEKRGTDEN